MKTHKWHKPLESDQKLSHKIKFKVLAQAAKCFLNLFGKALSKRIKATILYATETGKSEDYAKRLSHIFSHAFNVNVMCMDAYDTAQLEQEKLLVIVTSTFGNGDPPENGESFAKHLQSLKAARESTANYENVKFAVFALGSSAYPNFCEFGRNVDNMLAGIGGERILQCATGDELCGQEQGFKDWSKKVFEDACEVFCIGKKLNLTEVMKSAAMKPAKFSAANVRLEPIDQICPSDMSRGLSKSSTRKLVQLSVLSVNSLYDTADGDGRKTINVQLKTVDDVSSEFEYLPGDHLEVYPENSPHLVAGIVSRLRHLNFDQAYQVLMRSVKAKAIAGRDVAEWVPHKRLPPTTLRDALTRYFDITTPPTQQLLSLMSTFVEVESERNELNELVLDSRKYDEWKATYVPNFLEVLQLFPSLKLAPEFIFTQLPPLQPRYYSISSSPAYNQLTEGGDDSDCDDISEMEEAMSMKSKSKQRSLLRKLRRNSATQISTTYCQQVDLTVAVVQYRTQTGATHEGVCSTFLANCKPGQTLYGFIRSAPSFRLPESEATPIIMVGPGTGIAPFRGMFSSEMFELEFHISILS